MKNSLLFMGLLLAFVANAQQHTMKVLNAITNEPIVGHH